MRKRRIITAFFLTTLILGATKTHSQGQSLGISPIYVDATVKRGATYDKAFNIFNGTAKRLRLRFSVGDYWRDQDKKRVDGRPGTLPRSASLWLQFSPAELIVEPGATATVTAVISVPVTASGGYYTSPIFEAEEADQSPAPNLKPGIVIASIMVRVSGLIMLTTDDNAEYHIELVGGAVTPPTSSSELRLSLDMHNRSTAHVRLRGVLAIIDSKGKIAGRGRIDEKRYMPDERDLLNAIWTGELAADHYIAVVTLSYDRAGMNPATLVYEIPFEVN